MKTPFVAVAILLFVPLLARGTEISITMDDLVVSETPLLTPFERNAAILKALRDLKLQSVIFVSGYNADNDDGRKLLSAWDEAGHWIANHTYSHKNYGSRSQDFATFSADFLRVDAFISSFNSFKKIFRFPYLKEGDTAAKRDEMRRFLKGQGYSQGYVTIDASDWYVDDRMVRRLGKDPNADLRGYRSFYLDHLWDRAQYYDRLAKQVLDREIKHTLLVHHNLLNALFLKDVIAMFRQRGWKVIDAKKAFADPIFALEPKILPAGESIVWALAKETGRFDHILRYPAEDGEYEREKMDKLGL